MLGINGNIEQCRKARKKKANSMTCSHVCRDSHEVAIIRLP